MVSALRTYALGFLVCALIIVGRTWAQAPLPPVDDPIEKDQKKRQVERLSREARELGREYLELLHELKEVMQDYSRYMAGVNSKATIEQQKELQALMARLSKGEYLRNMTRLEADLERAGSELESQEAYLKKENRKAYTLSRNLQRSLEAINIQLESEVADRIASQSDYTAALRHYFVAAADDGRVSPEKLKEVYVGLLDDDGSIRVVIPDLDFDFDFDFELPELEGLDSSIPQVYVVAPNQPATWIGTITPPSPPTPPAAITGSRSIVMTGLKGQTQVVKQSVDSLRVSSRSNPITITNPNGVLRVTGWDRDLIMVRSEIGVSADEPAAASRLAEKIRLELKRSDEGYTVGYLFPDLTDPRQQVTNQHFEVVVPTGNPIAVTCSFGSVTVENLENSLAITANNASVLANQIDGPVAITGSMAPVALEFVDGAISVVNRHAAIQLTQCSGTITATNEYALISLDQCDGPARIRNSGEVRVIHHDGDVTVDNSNGIVMVQHSQGNFRLTTAFQPLTIEYIEGTVTAGNSHAPIFLNDISGQIRAENTFAPIKGELLTGPINLTNLQGPIFVNLTSDFEGPSQINSTGGIVNLTLEPGIDLFIRATTVNGDIQSSFPVSITGTGITKTAEFSLGRARPSLTVTGNKSQIMVREE